MSTEQQFQQIEAISDDPRLQQFHEWHSRYGQKYTLALQSNDFDAAHEALATQHLMSEADPQLFADVMEARRRLTLKNAQEAGYRILPEQRSAS